MFQSTKKFHIFARIIVWTCLALLVLLGGFQVLPLGQYGTDYLQNASVQRTRSQIFVKSALMLEYGKPDERPQAISDMQVSLPLFVQEQKVLLANPNPDVVQKVRNAQPDYQAIVQATQKILAQTDKPVDKIQVDILVAHNRNFLLAETEVLTLIQANLLRAQLLLFIIESVLDMLLLVLITWFLIVFERQHKNLAGETS